MGSRASRFLPRQSPTPDSPIHEPGADGQLRQEPSRRRPDHNDPLSGDHHGFDDF